MDETTNSATTEGATPLSDLIGPDRHRTLETHEQEREVGGAPLGGGDAGGESAPAAPAPTTTQSTQPAPKAAQPPKSGAQPAPAGDQQQPAQAGAEPDPNDPSAPRWYREHMRKVNRELAQLRAERGPEAPAAQPSQQPGGRGPQQPRLPNPAEDPEGYHRAITSHYNAQLAQMRVEQTLTRSEDRVRARHGDDTFEDVKAWLGTQSEELEDYFTRQPDPWGAAYAHYQREQLAQEIGDDPAAYEARIREKILAELAAGREVDTSQHIPAQPSRMRASPPPPASQARSAQPRDDGGRFAGQTPLSGALKHGGARR